MLQGFLERSPLAWPESCVSAWTNHCGQRDPLSWIVWLSLEQEQDSPSETHEKWLFKIRGRILGRKTTPDIPNSKQEKKYSRRWSRFSKKVQVLSARFRTPTCGLHIMPLWRENSTVLLYTTHNTLNASVLQICSNFYHIKKFSSSQWTLTGCPTI